MHLLAICMSSLENVYSIFFLIHIGFFCPFIIECMSFYVSISSIIRYIICKNLSLWGFFVSHFLNRILWVQKFCYFLKFWQNIMFFSLLISVSYLRVFSKSLSLKGTPKSFVAFTLNLHLWYILSWFFYMVWCWSLTASFAYWYTVVPEQFVKKTIISLLNSLCNYIKNQYIINVIIGGLLILPLIYVSILMPVKHCLDCHRLISFKVWLPKFVILF